MVLKIFLTFIICSRNSVSLSLLFTKMWMNSSAFDFCTRVGITGIKLRELSAHIALSPKHQKIVKYITSILLIQGSPNRTLNYSNNDEGWWWIGIMEEQQKWKRQQENILWQQKLSQSFSTICMMAYQFIVWHWLRACFKDSLENRAKQCITLTFSRILNSNLFYNEKLYTN